MEKLKIIGRTMFAVAIIGLGVEHFVFQKFVVGRAPEWPASVPGGLTWAYTSGVVFVILGIITISGKRARVACMMISLLVFVGALLWHVPEVTAAPFLSPAWTTAGKALTFFGGALAVASTFPKTLFNSPLSRLIHMDNQFIVLGRLCLGIFMIICGIQHYMYTVFVASLIPSWFPGDAVLWTYFGGVTLIGGGVGLFIPRMASLAALLSGVMVLSWFFIVHIPRVMESISDGIAVFEALAVSGIAFVLVDKKSGQGLISF